MNEFKHRNASFYLGNEGYLWPLFKKSCEREGKKASKVLLEYVRNYVEKHDPGNPQTRVTSFSDIGELTIAGIEGRVRQHCLQRSKKIGFINLSEIKQFIREEDVPRQGVYPMSLRIMNWLKERSVKVWN